MITQSPELLIYKRIDAEKRVDNYLLVAVIFKNGIVFGKKFNERQDEKGQWLLEINSDVKTAGIGDLHDFETCISALSDFCQEADNTLGKHYMTGKGIEKFLSDILGETFSEGASALAVNFIVTDWRDRRKEPSLWFIDFDGEIKQLKNFAVAGGSEYEEILDLEKLTPEQKKESERKKFTLMEKEKQLKDDSFEPVKINYPRKKAIAYLEEKWKPYLEKEKAVELVKNTLFAFDPESKDREIEIIVFEKGKKEIEASYFKRK